MNQLAFNIADKFQTPFTKVEDIGGLISLVLQASFVLAGIIILFLLIFAGFSIIAGAGNDDPQTAAKGKQAATAAVIGFVIIFSAYWIIRIIETITGISFITGI